MSEEIKDTENAKETKEQELELKEMEKASGGGSSDRLNACSAADTK